MKIGNVKINGPATLAPMAGVADRAFRELCTEFGAAYVTGEMVSAKGLCMNDRKSQELLFLSPAERPAGVQIFGDDPQIMAQAAVKSLSFTPEFIDINMGCPAPKIANNGGGSALMKQPLLAQEIVSACVKVTILPVSVKLRTGWDDKTVNAPLLAALCEQAGAGAITIHGRTRTQMYAPPIDFDTIRQVKQAVRIPVIGNGDVSDGKSAADMLERTGCDMVMVGRGALGRPWVFSQINAYLKDGTVEPEPSIEQRMEIMLRHMKMLCRYKGDYIGMKEARKHAAWYIKGIRGAAAYRQETGRLTTIEQLEQLAEKVIADNRSAC
ncbi:MAG TPA: tRNA dihydrouridine synthase DusB [Clostridia bacterium]|nr:tRNA dihydrouridine synthase DusB [Clostridia bacterium]